MLNRRQHRSGSRRLDLRHGLRLRLVAATAIAAAFATVATGAATPAAAKPPPPPTSKSNLADGGTSVTVEGEIPGNPERRKNHRKPTSNTNNKPNRSTNGTTATRELKPIYEREDGTPCRPQTPGCIPRMPLRVTILDDPAPHQPTITPATAAKRAIAQINLRATPPQLTPDWTKNQYKMIPVGFPVWIHAQPNSLKPLTDTQTIDNLTVTLTANTPTITTTMGDNTTLTCAAQGRPFNPTTDTPGTNGPCSHRYTRMSPKTGYTVTATYTWNIQWTTNNQTGTITITDQATRQIPIGELQALTTTPR